MIKHRSYRDIQFYTPRIVSDRGTVRVRLAEFSPCLTMSDSQNSSAATLLSCEHSRLRRAERLVSKRDLQAALKHGSRVVSLSQRGLPVWKYSFADVVFIVDQTLTKEITCWAQPGAGLDVEKQHITSEMERAHQAARIRLQNNCSWTSHTVVVVDQSGSMRKTDLAGGATRSDAVWLTLAVDFVAKHIEAGTATAMDVVSVISMGADSKVLIDRQPHDWLLFNKVVDLLRTQEPFFDGNYVPALDAAERLLLSNEFGACALSLFFLSDGKPSDRLPKETMEPGSSCMMTGFVKLMSQCIDSLASRFGRRLSVTTVGFGGPGEDFRVLEKLAERPAQFGCVSRFISAELNVAVLGAAFSSISSSLNSTKTELTAVGGSSQRAVRDVRRQARDTVGKDTRPDSDWLVYMFGKGWHGERREWVPAGPQKGWKDNISMISPEAYGVAFKANYFGEGAERLVREFREVGLDGTFVGLPLVAKESRFQADVANMDPERQINFHRTFCDTQVRASGLAAVFNSKLAQLPRYNRKTTPIVSFLECTVYVVDDISMGRTGFLVEKQLDPTKYKKWNDNQGFVDGQAAVPVGALEPLSAGGALGALIEEDEEADSDEEEAPQPGDDDEICIDDIPQAFSHFTYRYTQRKVLVCDLQGVLSSNSSDPCFEFTDPVIHFRSRRGRNNVFGRTDRGPKGVDDFFKSHTCSPLCRALNRRWVKRVGEQQRGAHLDGLEDQVSNLKL